jgi:hypothetical protein
MVDCDVSGATFLGSGIVVESGAWNTKLTRCHTSDCTGFGFGITQVDSVDLTMCTAQGCTGVNGAGMKIANQGNADPNGCKHVRVVGGNFSGNTDGISVTDGSSGITLTAVSATENVPNGINTGNGVHLFPGPVSATAPTEISLTGCVVRGNGGYGALVDTSVGNVCVGSVFDGNAADLVNGIHLINAGAMTAVGCQGN